jgi:uncharacterized protein YlxP (DUF503 family)
VPFLIALTIHLHFPDSGSLKGKRKDLLSVRSTLNRRFGASVAEVADQDLWQRATLAVALVSRTASDVEHVADAVERYLYARFPESVRVERRLLSFEDIDD